MFATDMRALSRIEQKKILSITQQKLYQAPEVFGKPLRKSLVGYRSLRVGPCRIIFRIEKKKYWYLLLHTGRKCMKLQKNDFENIRTIIIRKRGTITLSKKIREELGLTTYSSLRVSGEGSKMILEPVENKEAPIEDVVE